MCEGGGSSEVPDGGLDLGSTVLITLMECRVIRNSRRAHPQSGPRFHLALVPVAMRKVDVNPTANMVRYAIRSKLVEPRSQMEVLSWIPLRVHLGSK